MDCLTKSYLKMRKNIKATYHQSPIASSPKGTLMLEMFPCHCQHDISNGKWFMVARLLCAPLTHLPLEKMAVISQTMFSDAFLWTKCFIFCLKFHWSLFLRVQLTIIQHRLYKGLAPNRRQAIILTNADPIHWRIYNLRIIDLRYSLVYVRVDHK